MIPTPTISEIIRAEFLEPLNINETSFAHNLNLSVNDIDNLYVTPEISHRLSKLFGVSENFFLNIQNDIDNRNLKFSLKNIRVNSVDFVDNSKFD